MGKANLRIGTRGYYHKGIENQAGNWSSNPRRSQRNTKSYSSLWPTPESGIGNVPAFLRDLCGQVLGEQIPELIRLHVVAWKNRVKVRISEMLQDDFSEHTSEVSGQSQVTAFK